MGRAFALALVMAAFAAPGLAQQPVAQTAVQTETPVLTLDWERLYENSLWGKRVAREIEAASNDLRQENNRIAAQLETEERDLTERRPKMDPASFQAAADAFDTRATAIRAAQKAKADAIQKQLNAERQAFLQAVMPKLDEVLHARGAEVVLDSRVIIRGLSSADVTDQLGARIDKEIGDGAGKVSAIVPPTGTQGGAPADVAGTSDATTPEIAPDTDAPPSKGGVYVDDSLNTKAKTGADPALDGGDPPDTTPPFGLSKPATQD